MVDLGDPSKEIQAQCFFRKFRSWQPKLTVVRRDSAPMFSQTRSVFLSGFENDTLLLSQDNRVVAQFSHSVMSDFL